MKLNLDSLKTEIQTYLQESGFVTFHGVSRGLDEMFEVTWDTERYPDFKGFLESAKALGIKLIVFQHREFSSEMVDEAIENVASSSFDYEDQRAVERRLRELAVYDGFTASIELSFYFENTLYVFELETDWNRELNDILEELALSSDEGGPAAEDDNLGGYYSKN